MRKNSLYNLLILTGLVSLLQPIDCNARSILATNLKQEAHRTDFVQPKRREALSTRRCQATRKWSPTAHVHHLKVDFQCRKTVLSLLRSTVRKINYGICAHISSVCVTTAQRYFSKIRSENDVCENIEIRTAMKKLIGCRNFIGALNGFDKK